MNSPTPGDPRDAYRRALTVFSGALRQTGEERRAFLDEACAGDSALRAEVDSLLDHDAKALASEERIGAQARRAVLGALEETPASPEELPAAEPRFAGDVGCEVGDTLGPYTLLQKIGEGTFGVVFAAEQAGPPRRRVALKVLKAGMDTREVIARFEAERNALSILNHPGIARVHEAGATPSGRPYFVMEYVEGIAVTDFCDEEQLTVEARLRLFVRICEAVQHAHQAGIIHRDLKPSNILVTLQDGRPQPKVIDFGIAKATHALSNQAVFTLQGQFLGTPEYMSPEQAEMSGVGVDSTTDIYALGVVLYELLTGVLPFEAAELRRQGLGAIHRYLSEMEPPRPSTRVSTVDASTTAVGRCRRSDPRTLRRDLQGDLDWIVMRALEKLRTRRYPSASELAADVVRHLQHEPVLAGPPSAVYRTRKFVRRHRVAVAFAVTVLVLLVGGIVGTTREMLAAERERDAADEARTTAEAAERTADLARADAQDQRAVAVEQRAVAVEQRELAEVNRDLATAEGERARAVTDFLLDTLGLADPDETELPEMSMAAALDVAAGSVGAAFGDYPESEAEVCFVIGRAYYTLGRPDLAQPQLRRALALYETVLPELERGRLNTLRVLWQVANRLNEGDWQNLAIETGNLTLRLLARTQPELAERLTALNQKTLTPFVLASDVKEEWDAIRASGLERLRPAEPAFGDLTSALRGVALRLGWGNPTGATAAAEMLETLLASNQKPLTNSAVRLLTENRLHFLIRAGDFTGARALLDERLTRLTEMLGPDHWYLGIYRYFEAVCLLAEGREAEAQVLLEQCLALLQSSSAPNLWESTQVLAALAELHESTGHPELAAPYRAELVEFLLSGSVPYVWTGTGSMLSPEVAEFVEAVDDFDALVRRCARNDAPLSSRAQQFEKLAERILEARRMLAADEDPVAMVMASHMALRGELLVTEPEVAPAGEALLVEAHRMGGFHRATQAISRIRTAALLRNFWVASGQEDRAALIGAELDELVRTDLPPSAKWGRISTRGSNELVWALVERPGLAPETYALVARFAVGVLLAAPEREDFVDTVGFALHRAGRFEEAIAQIEEARRLRRDSPTGSGGRGEVADLACLAMAQHGLGRKALASAALDDLDELMSDPAVGSDPVHRMLVDEARAVLASGR